MREPFLAPLAELFVDPQGHSLAMAEAGFRKVPDVCHEAVLGLWKARLVRAAGHGALRRWVHEGGLDI